MLCHSFSIAENRHDKQNFIAGASNLVKNAERSNFEKVVSQSHCCFDVLFKPFIEKGSLKITDTQEVVSEDNISRNL